MSRDGEEGDENPNSQAKKCAKEVGSQSMRRNGLTEVLREKAASRKESEQEESRKCKGVSWLGNYFFNQVFSKHLILLIYSSISIAEQLRWDLKGILYLSNNVSYHKRQSLSPLSCKFLTSEY